MFDLTFLANKIMGAVAALIGVAGFAVFYIPPKLRGKPALMVGMLGTHVNPFRKAKK